MALTIRIPLVQNTVVAVVHRLDIVATRAVNPPGPSTSGMDDYLHDLVVYDDPVTGLRTSSRREMTAVRVPCQVEVMTDEMLRKTLGGDAPVTRDVLVMHRRDLDRLGLLDATTRDCLLRRNDRVSVLERNGAPGTVVKTLGTDGAGLFIFEVRAGSWGLGPDGHDLELVFLQERALASMT